MGELFNKLFERVVRPLLQFMFVLPLVVCIYVVMFCNKSMLQRKEGREERKREGEKDRES